MCAILDASVVHEVFGESPPAAGKKFFKWVAAGRRRMVVGGKQLAELKRGSEGFRKWMREAILAGHVHEINRQVVDEAVEQIEKKNLCRSNDPHIIALGQVSGARLLYSNDADLQKDFTNSSLIESPRGKVYSTHEFRDFRDTHKKLLGRKDLCRRAGK